MSIIAQLAQGAVRVKNDGCEPMATRAGEERRDMAVQRPGNARRPMKKARGCGLARVRGGRWAYGLDWSEPCVGVD